MFGLTSPLVGLTAPISYPVVPPPESQKLIDAIRDQTAGTPPHMVYVIDIVSVRFGGYFTNEIKA
jgi:hypothetical protein